MPSVDVVVVPMAGDLDPSVEGEALLALHRSDTVVELARRGVRWVHCFSTGVDGLPIEVFEGRVVTCSRGASATPISEWVLAAVLAFEKRLPESWVTRPPKNWGWTSQLGELNGKTLGLIGLGGIGTAVATRALAFGMRVVAVRRTDRPSALDGVEVVRTLPDLLPQADHLVLAAPATARTERLLDADALTRVKRGVHVVNIARGTLVDQDALLSALDDGRVAMATLDVTDPEPLPRRHPFYAHPRVRLSPHISWGSERMADRIVELFVDNLRRYVAGQPLEGVVDPAEGY